MNRAWLIAISVLLLGSHLSVGQAPDYLKEIKPILKEHCYSCHGALRQKADLRLDTAALARKGSKKGPVIFTGAPSESPLYLRITSPNPEERMPQEAAALPPEKVEKLRRWIEAGAPGPNDELPEANPLEHWSFKPIRRPVVPEVKLSFPIRNPIDAFIAKEWLARDLKPSLPAEKAILLRRVYLDLVGLSPTVEQLREFLADDRPDSYERVVEDLLASPRYGERWARHWMDIWRYADWYGRRHVPDVWNSAPQVWRWREWIVESLNGDKGYDRMILEMLAGDEVASADPKVNAATGFLVRNWYALNPNQWMRDNVEHTAKAFLGLTLNCAHCHDHKYDPITQRDYFSFRAFFEPIGARQDWLKGEPDPGPFQKYEYSSLRKIVTNGVVRVYDETLDAKTFIYLKGDERNFPQGKPIVEPRVPVFLEKGAEDVMAKNLPPEASYPGLQEWIRNLHRERRLKDLNDAKKTLAGAEEKLGKAKARMAEILRDAAGSAGTGDVGIEAQAVVFADWLKAQGEVLSASNRVVSAQAELDSTEARLKADAVRFLGEQGETNEVASAASLAERKAAAVQARNKLVEAQHGLGVLKAEHALSSARRAAAGVSGDVEKKEKEAEQAAIKKIADQVASLEKALQEAEAAFKTNSLAYTSFGPVYPQKSTGRRTALAKWLTSRENPLTARVAVNHIWSRHFHAPLVKSVFDFGRNGSEPAHPDLLDWLAAEFVESGWSMKHLHRLIVTSSVYRIASSYSPEMKEDLDPENRWLARMNPGQLEAELVRDNLLHAAGELDSRVGGPVLPNTDAEKTNRRSLYYEVFPEAGGHSPFAEMFDPPNPNDCYRRTTTIVPQQALALSNSKLVSEKSERLANRLETKCGGDDKGFVVEAWETILGRTPTQEEQAACIEFLQNQAALVKGENTQAEKVELKARVSLVRALFNHNDFMAIR